MAAHFWTTRRRRIALIVAIPIFLLFIVLFSLNAILAPILARKIKAAVIIGSDSLYSMTFSNIHINIFTGNAELDDIKLTSDSTRAKSAASVAGGTAKLIKISNAHFFNYWLHKRVEIGELILVDPDLTYIIQKKSKHKSSVPLYQKIDPVKLVAVQHILLNSARLTLSDLTGLKPNVQHLKELDLEATGLLIDPTSGRDSSRTLFCKEISVTLNNFSGYTDGGLYHYGLKKALFSTQSGKLVINNIFLRPLSIKPFFQKSNSDRFECSLDSLVVEHFNYRSFLRDHFLTIKKVSAYRGSIGVFGNPNGKINKTDRIRTFPHFMIRKLPVHFTVDTADVSGLAVSYRELNKVDGKIGLLEFKDTKSRFLNICNQAEKLKTQPFCRAQLSSMFMGKGKFDLSIDFNLVDQVYAYHYRGHLAAIPLEMVNPLAMPLGLVKIKSGELKALDFSIRADRSKSTGTLHLLYDNLAVDVLNPDYSTKVLKTLAVKVLVLKKNNPGDPRTPARFAKVVFLRPKSYPFFKTLWETLFSGLKPCAGFGYAVKPDPGKPLTKKEEKAKTKALKKAVKAKKKADQEFKKKLKN